MRYCKEHSEINPPVLAKPDRQALARLATPHLAKVEATKFTEVGRGP